MTAPLDLAVLLRPPKQRPLRRLPTLVLGSLRLVRSAAPRELAWTGGLQVVAGLGIAVQVLLLREVLQAVLDVGAGSEASSVVVPLALLMGVAAVVTFASLARVEQQRLLSELVGRRAVDQVLEVSTSVDLLAYESPEFHNRLQRALVNASSRPAQMVTGVLGLVSSSFALIGLGVALLLIEPVFVAVVMLGYAPLSLAASRASRVSYDFGVEQTERDRRRAYLTYVLSGRDEAAEVRSFALGPLLRGWQSELWASRISALRGVVRKRLRYGLVGGLVATALTGGSVLLLVTFVDSGRLTLAEAGAAAGALVLLGQRLQALASSAGALYESALFVEDFTTFVEAMPAVRGATATLAPPTGFDRLVLQDVGFTYPSSERPALSDVSLEVEAGQVVALVGENGSGKTTLAKIIAGLYPPGTGVVRWDHVDLAACDPDLVRQSVAVVFQDFVHYVMTAHENIAVGALAAFEDRERVVTAARKADADSFLTRLPQGYDSKLGAEYYGGSDLSIGQWQRVALARAFVRDAPLLILDEPTAALDPRAEAQLFQSIRDLYHGRTVLLISHRFSSVRSADVIFVLHEGRITERGGHDELMALGGTYAELFTMQAAAYLDPSDRAAQREGPAV